jgi:UDP-glucuronate 4-epimerase
MAIHRFVEAIDQGQEVPLFDNGMSKRDYTYVDDIVNGFEKAVDSQQKGYQIFNLGAGNAVGLRYVVGLIESALGKKAGIRNLPNQPGDVPLTLADVSKARSILGYDPQVSIEHGISRYIRWYLESQR